MPCLKAGGARVFIDYEQFKAGEWLVGQMDATQDRAKVQFLVFSEEYLKREYFVHEMNRAIDRDPLFQNHVVIPVLRADCALPDRIRQANPIGVDLRNDRHAEPWDLLLDPGGAELGATAPDWIRARDEVRRVLLGRKPVNLVADEGT